MWTHRHNQEHIPEIHAENICIEIERSGFSLLGEMYEYATSKGLDAFSKCLRNDAKALCGLPFSRQGVCLQRT